MSNNPPSYAILNTETFQKLNKLNATRSSLQVLIALNAYAMGKDTAFPNLQTIKDYIGSNIGLNTISMALKWLRENGLIKQNGRKSKDRFVLTFRKAVKLAKLKLVEMKKSCRSGRQSTSNMKQSLSSTEDKKRTTKNSFKRKGKKIIGEGFVSNEELKRRRDQAIKRHNSAENAMARCIMGQCPTTLTEASKVAIKKEFSKANSDLRVWARETNQEPEVLAVLEKIKSCGAYFHS